MGLKLAGWLLLAAVLVGLPGFPGLAAAQQTVPCNMANVIDVSSGTIGFAPVANRTYRFLGGVNTLASTYVQPSGTFLCLLGVNGAVLKPPASAMLISQNLNASLYLRDLAIDGGSDTSTGEY